MPGTRKNCGKSQMGSPPALRGKMLSKRRARLPKKEAQYRAALPTFIAELCACGSVTAAARIACIDRSWAYKHATKDPEFAVAFAEAKSLGDLALEDEARRRALHGWDEPVIHQGRPQYGFDDITGEKVAITIRKHSDVLLIFLLKGAFPEKYKDRTAVDIAGSITTDLGLDFEQLDVDELVHLRNLLTRAKKPDIIDVEPEQISGPAQRAHTVAVSNPIDADDPKPTSAGGIRRE